MKAALARRAFAPRDGYPPQHPQIGTAIAARTVVVRAEHSVQHSVQAVLDLPVPPYQTPTRQAGWMPNSLHARLTASGTPPRFGLLFSSPVEENMDQTAVSG